MRPGGIIIALWIGFALSWVVAAWWSSRPASVLGMRKEAPSRILLLLGGILFFIPAHGYDGPLRLWFPSWWLAWLSVMLIISGFAFSWWARIELGSLWSANITRKPGHEVIDHGAFAIVRHPIYTGILLAVFGTLLVKGTILGIAGALLIAIGLWLKARLEESWLSQELDASAYEAYRKHVPMLIPFGPKG
jgi:protein-S-isoprenylcysteine O-methyltransferase Ste14